jgi:hypothetical protein
MKSTAANANPGRERTCQQFWHDLDGAGNSVGIQNGTGEGTAQRF